MIDKNINKFKKRFRNTDGFSITELIVVLVLIGILSAMSIPYIYNYRRVYRSEEQAMTAMDLMKETSQLALTRRRTYRFEIDLTANKYLIIDENGVGAGDDIAIKQIPMVSPVDIRVDKAPAGVSRPNPPNYNDAVFATDTIGHTSADSNVISHDVWAARFQSNGTVVNAAGTPISATLYFWAPLDPGNDVAKVINEVRAVTLFGGSGAVKYWKFHDEAFVPNQ